MKNLSIKSNSEKLIKMVIAGYVSQPSFRSPGYIPDNNGKSVIFPGMYGISNNIKVSYILLYSLFISKLIYGGVLRCFENSNIFWIITMLMWTDNTVWCW